MTMAKVMWVHGHSMSIEHPERLNSIWRAGFFGQIVGRSGQNTWIHFAIPTQLVDDNRLRIDSSLIRFRTTPTDAWIAAVHIYDGETKIAAHDDLHEAPGEWAVRRFAVPGTPEVQRGIGISINVAFHIDTAVATDSWRIEFSSVGCHFLQEPLIPFGGKIYTSEIKDSVTDMQGILSKYTGHEFRIETLSTESNEGIYLIKEELNEQTGQRFYLKKEGLHKAILKYTVDTSLDNAIYTFLDLLGFRWYGPGENWFHSPRNLNPKGFDKYIEPSFRNRDFSPSGGVSYSPPYDPQNTFVSDWDLWRKRNRYNSDFYPQGHAGIAFSLALKDDAIKHERKLDARWFCSGGIDTGRIKIEVPEAVEAYKEWARGLYHEERTFNCIGVEPEDGAGGADDCLPAGMDIENFSEKWFWLANEVAKEFDPEDKRTVVSMFAYGNDAKVPRFPLQPNVYPIIIPYAFQSTYVPNEMIREWRKAVDGMMGIYDYWNITQWSKGLPQFDIYTIQPKIALWNEYKIEGILCESTWGAGPMGHAHWLAGQLEFDATKNFDELYTQYLTDCFAAGASDMRKMFDRWSLQYQGIGEISLSLADLKAALEKVLANGIEYKRILELAAYIHYMRLYYEQKTVEDFNRTIQYLDAIHHLRMVQTAPMRQTGYIRVPGWETNPDYNMVQATYESIYRQFEKDLADYPVKYTLIDFNFDNTKASPTPDQPVPQFWFGKEIIYYLQPKASGPIMIQLAATVEVVLKVYTDDEVLFKEEIKQRTSTEPGDFDYEFDWGTILPDGTSQWHYFAKDVMFHVERGQKYTIRASGGYIKMRFPGHELFFQSFGSQVYDNHDYPTCYFYVPGSATEIIFEDIQRFNRESGRGSMVPPGGSQPLTRELLYEHIYRVPVAEEFRGKIWKAVFGHPNYRLLNIPNIGSLVPFNYSE
ncbi:DUF6623 family protein [Nitrosospira multiformis]|uniref:DUF6623 family protein n=1 Tax=Nitrosospira multiformis TaxID=1231 RepID=UPI0008952690|nr:DUF6623 family protein [Nitrosospira multiformis]SEA65974.1 protein of unknown function [Nitrosospira multiformis]